MEVGGKEGMDLKSISEVLHGEGRKWVGVSDTVNESPLDMTSPGLSALEARARVWLRQ